MRRSEKVLSVVNYGTYDIVMGILSNKNILKVNEICIRQKAAAVIIVQQTSIFLCRVKFSKFQEIIA